MLFTIRLFLLLAFCFWQLAFAVNNPIYAQFFTSEEFGGKVTCRLSGDIQGLKRKITFSGDNSIIVNSTSNTVELEIEGDESENKKDYFFTLSVPIEDIGDDLFSSDSVHETENSDVEFSLLESDDNGAIELTNLADLVEEEAVAVLVKIDKLKNKLASGSIKARFTSTALVFSDDSTGEDAEVSNGKVIVTCDFFSVPAYLEK